MKRATPSGYEPNKFPERDALIYFVLHILSAKQRFTSRVNHDEVRHLVTILLYSYSDRSIKTF